MAASILPGGQPVRVPQDWARAAGAVIHFPIAFMARLIAAMADAQKDTHGSRAATPFVGRKNCRIAPSAGLHTAQHRRVEPAPGPATKRLSRPAADVGPPGA